MKSDLEKAATMLKIRKANEILARREKPEISENQEKLFERMGVRLKKKH
jgi:hypothetical protein